MLNDSHIFEKIFDYVQGLEIIDTHEHLPCCEDAREKEVDVLKEYLSHYFSQDLVSAGLRANDYRKIVDHRLPLIKRWKLVEPTRKAIFSGRLSMYIEYGVPCI